MVVNFEAKDRICGRLLREPIMTTPADRLTTLEIRIAEQDRIIEELSAEIARQWKVIERLQKKLDALTDRFLVLEEQTAPPIEAAKPPHY